MNVLLGHSKKDRKKHCSDGDSVYITGSVHNELVRLSGIDAPEVRGLDLDKLEESKFLYVLDDNLLEYLTPKLTRESIETHKKLGFRAREYLESILDENLEVTFGRETFGRYGRPLVYLGDGHKMYNVTLVKSGFAIPYFIFPNAVPITEEGEYTYEHIKIMQKAAAYAQEHTLGIWEVIDDILIPMELRYLTRRELPEKFCADLETGVLYPPKAYYRVPVVNRLFFYPKDVALAVCMGFQPVRGCDSWLHKIWRGLHPGSKRREIPGTPEKILRGK
ncbi:MAG: thermonuclease family protein [Candidatus Methanofastidiosia archaeon]|jgi:endonuclease YncB( thermonuclease family)